MLFRSLPKHDAIGSGEFGNAIRGPLGIHRGANRRFWFYGADYTLEAQIAYLSRLRKVTERNCGSSSPAGQSPSLNSRRVHSEIFKGSDKRELLFQDFAFSSTWERCERLAGITSRDAPPAPTVGTTGAATTWPS